MESLGFCLLHLMEFTYQLREVVFSRSIEIYAIPELPELENDVVELILPPISEDDPLHMKKKALLTAKNIDLTFRLQLSEVPFQERLVKVLDNIMQAARVLHLDETELYFMEEDDIGPFSSRNELESLNLVSSVIDKLFLNAGNKRMELLHFLDKAVLDKISSLEGNCTEEKVIGICHSGTEANLLEWGKKHGMRTKLQIAEFDSAGRGVLAIEDLNIGDCALEIPQSIIISEQLVNESIMFNILNKMDGISSETMVLLWSMSERHNPASKFKAYFDTLPKDFNTGLSFGLDALAALEGTLLLEEILQAREHLRKQYDELCPPLCASYPHIFMPEIYTWDHFLWACELWYSNSMKVVFADGKTRTCLVPVAGFLNHSLWPHVLHYGKIDAESGMLKFCTSRPCKRGKECYLSYGTFSSSHLVNFYGFLAKGDNPYDIIPLDIDTPQVDVGMNWSTHMVRGTWLSRSKKPNYGLPSPLLLHLRYAMSQNEPDSSPTQTLGEEQKSLDIERAVLETIISIFSPMMEALAGVDDLQREATSWDVRLALDFKDLQRRIVSSVLDSCSTALQKLDSSDPSY